MLSPVSIDYPCVPRTPRVVVMNSSVPRSLLTATILLLYYRTKSLDRKFRRPFWTHTFFLARGLAKSNCAHRVRMITHGPSKLARVSPHRAAWLILDCARRTSTVLSCAFCEQGGHLAAPSSSLPLALISRRGVGSIHEHAVYARA